MAEAVEAARSAQDTRGARLITKLRRELGQEVVHLLEDPRTIELMINPDGWLWVERFGEECVRVERLRSAQVHSVIATVAASLDRVVNAEHPILEGELPIDGSRFEGLLPPIVSAPAITIRKRASRVFSLSDYVGQGVMTESQRQILCSAVSDRRNILIAGGTGSGKTTLTNAMISAIVEATPSDRLVLIEDTYELQCTAQNVVSLHATESVSMDQLLRATLRLRPDRILVGEVRGSEALALLKAWNTGHPGGMATLHANSPAGALTRLEQLVGEGSQSSDHIPALVAEAVDLVVFIEKVGNRRLVSAMAEVLEPRRGGGYRLREPGTTEQRQAMRAAPQNSSMARIDFEE